MSNCIACGNPVVLKEAGTVTFITSQTDLQNKLSIPYELTTQGVRCTYQSFTELEAITQEFNQVFHSDSTNVLVNGNVQLPFNQFYTYLYNRELVELIIHGEFPVHLQPIIKLSTGGLHGYEALLRPELKGMPVSPQELFEVAEASGLQSLLDQKARKAAVMSKHENIPEDMYLFINFLPSTIYNPEFCLKHTFSIIEEFNVNPEKLVFEVVETEEVQDMEHLKSILETYKRNGMNVALDDVGSGYSTLDVLTSLNPDIVKIDRHYISGCFKDEIKQAFLKKVMAAAQQLGIKVLAEGIEDQKELDYCKSIGVDFAQGYFIGKPQKNPLQSAEAAQLSF